MTPRQPHSGRYVEFLHQARRARDLGLCLLLGSCALAAFSCSDDTGEEPGTTSLVPDDWEDRLEEVRDCRRSIDHDLEYVRLFISSGAVESYEECVIRGECDAPLAVGSLFLKPQYRDAACEELERYSVAKRESKASAPGEEGWRWQEVSAGGKVVVDGAPKSCTGCHSLCDGYDLRCAMDP